MEEMDDLRGTADTLAQWVAGLRFADLPADVVSDARMCCIDSIACLVGGLDLEPSRILLSVLAEAGGGEVLLPGMNHGMNLLHAAYFGAQTANALDFDDSFVGHPGATIVPPALALAGQRGLSGQALLTAVVSGYEVSLRIGRAIAPSYPRKRQVSGHSSWQTFGAVAAAGHLAGLSGDAMRHAFGLAGAQAPVPQVRKFIDGYRPYTWIKNAYGAAAEMGILSALMAEGGYLGNQEIFDGPHGFWIMAGSDRYQRGLATEGLGALWLIRNVGFKYYACCRWTQTILDTIEDLRPHFDPQKVTAVDVHGYEEISLRFGGDLPDNIIDAQFNARYLTALQILDRSASEGLRDADLSDPAVAEMAARISLHHDPAKDAGFREQGLLPVTTVVTLDDGRELTASREHPTGSKALGGFSVDVMSSKFLNVVVPRIGMKRAEAALEMLFDLENHEIGEVLKALRP